MSIEKNHSIYTGEDIKRYLSGGMSNAEMYAFEKAALDDPFLAEAIEGYEGMEQKDWNKELATLKQKLEAVENAPVVPFHKSSFTKWWKAAAAVLVIGTSVAVAYFSTGRQAAKNEMIAATKNTTDSLAAIAKLDTAVNSVAGNISPVAIEQNKNLTVASGTFAVTDSTRQILLADATTNEKGKDEFVYTPSPVTAGTLEKNGVAGKSENPGSYKSRADIATANQGTFYNTKPGELNAANADKELSHQNNNEADSYRFKNNDAVNYFSAQVTTPDNKPVAYANIAVPKSIKPVYTDAKGNFGFSAADSAVNVVVTSAGYTPQKFRLQNSAAQNKIVLQPDDLALKEVSVGKKKAIEKLEVKKETGNEDITGEEEDDAEPLGGWVEYNNYLSNNLIFPNEAKEKNIHGEVELFVKLKSNGDISKVKVGKPLCMECDAEAVRLVKEGPKWEVKKNKASRATVKIKF